MEVPEQALLEVPEHAPGSRPYRKDRRMTQVEAERLLEEVEAWKNISEEYKKVLDWHSRRITELEGQRDDLLSTQTQLRRRIALLIEHCCCEGLGGCHGR